MRSSRRMSVLVAVLLAIGVVGFYLTEPSTLPSSLFEARSANLANGENMFNVGGCISCHGKKQDSGMSLGGGLVLHSPFGSFKVPNISSSADHGIGAWSEAQFANAMLRGIGRNGEHLYPSFPYTSYRRMSVADVRDLYAFLKTLPSDPTRSEPHDLQFPFNIRRAIGAWKLLFFDEEPFSSDRSKDAAYDRGAYLVEGPGHCAECHSPRNVLGAIKASDRFAGGPIMAGDGWVPNITPHPDGLQSWSLKDMEYFLETGVGPDSSSVSGEMEEVVRNLARLSAVDRHAMATYLKALPPRPGNKPAKKRPAKALTCWPATHFHALICAMFQEPSQAASAVDAEKSAIWSGRSGLSRYCRLDVRLGSKSEEIGVVRACPFVPHNLTKWMVQDMVRASN